MHVWVTGDLDWDYYLNELLDQQSNRLSGRPFRSGTDNQLAVKIRKEPRIVSAGRVAADDIRNQVAYDELNRGNREIFHAVARALWTESDSTSDFRAMRSRMDAFGFDVSGVDGAVFFLFDGLTVTPSSVVTCPNCGLAYDLDRDTLMVTDEDMDAWFAAAGIPVVHFGGPRHSLDLLMKTPKYSAKDRERARRRSESLGKDPSLRWSCDSCGKQGMGYPGSLMAWQVRTPE